MKCFFSTAILIVLAVSPAFGEQYENKDRNDNAVITDQGGKDYSALESRDGGVPAPRREELRKKDYSSVTVKMYMTDWCGYCKKAREYIRSFGAELVEYDVDKDKSKRDEMRQKISGSGVPVIDIEGTIIRGYDTEAIKAALDQYAR